jgi:hypothetical protein
METNISYKTFFNYFSKKIIKECFVWNICLHT